MLEKTFFDLSPLKYPKLAPKFEKNSKISQKMKKTMSLWEAVTFLFIEIISKIQNCVSTYVQDFKW